MKRLSLKSITCSSEESKDIAELLAQKRSIEGYKNMSNDELYDALRASENENHVRIEKIREEIKKLQHKFSRQELKEIIKNLYEIENRKGRLESKKTKKYLNKLGEKISKLNKYNDYDDIKYIGISDLRDLFDSSISEDYYKPIIVNSASNNNYIQYESKGDKILTIKDYLSTIESYLVDMINDHKNQDEWKIQLSAEINFTSFKRDSDETRIMHTKSDNLEIRIGSDTNEVIEDLFKSLLQRYQEGLEEKMKGSEFLFDDVNGLYYDLNKINLDRGGSYTDSPEWIKSKKATTNPQNKKDEKCFQYALTVELNHEKIKDHPERISKIKPFIDQYNWNEIDFPSTGKDWKKFESNNKSIALNILYVPHNTEKICHAYKLKYNLTRENQVIVLMITEVEKWHYFAVKSLSALLRLKTGNNHGDFYCINCFCAYTTENKLESRKKVCENHDCSIEMPNEDNKILKYNHGEKSMKAPFIIYADLESLLEKMNTCYDSPEKSSTTKINKHTPSGYSLFTHCSSDGSKNKIGYYRGEDCMKKFGLDLREHVTKIINYEKKEMVPLI